MRRPLVVLLWVVFTALLAAPAGASPVAKSESEYLTYGRVFPDPLAGCTTAPCNPDAQGNVPANQFIGIEEFLDGLEFMNTQDGEEGEQDWARYMEVLTLDGRFGDGAATKAEVEADPATMFPGNNRSALEFEPKPEYVSAGLPTTTLEREKSDLTVVRVTDESVPDAGKKRYTLSLSIHGIERAGAEGGTRAMEDLVTAFTAGTGRDGGETKKADERILAEAVRADAPTFADVLRKTIIYFTYPNPDGWRRGSVQQGGVFFQRYNGNGIDPNRDWPDIGYTFRPYSGGSEPETRAFQGFYDGVLETGPFAAGDDLHGQPGADALSYTLLPHGSHTLGKDARIRETAKTINRSTYESIKWSPAVKENDEVSEPSDNPSPCAPAPILSYCTQIYPQTWGSVYDTINYTTTGTLGDWFDSDVGLKADGIDNEMSFSHLDKNIVFNPHDEQLHVDGNKALIYAHVADMLAPLSARMDAPGAQGYVPNRRLQRDEQVFQQPPPDGTEPQEPFSGTGTASPAEGGAIPVPFDVQRSPEIYNGGMRVEATTPNFQGVSSGSANLKVQCRNCDDHVGVEASDEWITVAEDFNQSPVYAQAGLVATVNRPQPSGGEPAVEWRALVDLTNAGGSPLVADVEVTFTEGPASSDGDTGGDDPPRLAGYDVANTDFFEDLNAFIPDPAERFRAVDPRAVIEGRQSLSDLRNLVLADDLLPGYTGSLAGVRRPNGPPTADMEIEDTKATVPGQGPNSCARNATTTDQHEFTIGSNDGNESVRVRIEWLLETSDWDLFLQRKDASGAFVDVASSAGFVTISEEVDVSQPPPGEYRVEVVNCSAFPDTNYTGEITFEPLEQLGQSVYTAGQKDAWVTKLREYVAGGGNLVLTDGALQGLQELTGVEGTAGSSHAVYTGQATFRRCTVYADDGTCEEDERTLDDPLARNVNQPGSRFNSGLRRQLVEPTPLGFSIQNATGGDDSNTPQYDVDGQAFEAAGGRVAGTSVDSDPGNASPILERASLGEIERGQGTIRVAGALLPQPSTRFDHPLGLEPYALTYTGYILICNLLDASCPTQAADSGGPGDPGDPGDPDDTGGAGGQTGAPGGAGTAAGGGGGQGGAPGGTAEPNACLARRTIAAASAKRSGRRGLRIGFRRTTSQPVTVDVFQQSIGRRVIGERLVARFADRTRGFRWNGRANRRGRTVRDGYFMVRYRMRGSGGVLDTRRLVLRRRGGRFVRRPGHFGREGCKLIEKFKLQRPVFGGTGRRTLGIAYRLAGRARVRVTVRRGKQVVKRYRTAGRAAGRTYRLKLRARGTRRGDHRVRVQAIRGGKVRETRTLTSRRL